eukprot:scaffold125851_cov48-Phaeocystis_antarctica.AAC.2
MRVGRGYGLRPSAVRAQVEVAGEAPATACSQAVTAYIHMTCAYVLVMHNMRRLGWQAAHVKRGAATEQYMCSEHWSQWSLASKLYVGTSAWPAAHVRCRAAASSSAAAAAAAGLAAAGLSSSESSESSESSLSWAAAAAAAAAVVAATAAAATLLDGGRPAASTLSLATTLSPNLSLAPAPPRPTLPRASHSCSCLSSQPLRLMPLPPNLGLSRQATHSPQSSCCRMSRRAATDDADRTSASTSASPSASAPASGFCLHEGQSQSPLGTCLSGGRRQRRW